MPIFPRFSSFLLPPHTPRLHVYGAPLSYCIDQAKTSIAGLKSRIAKVKTSLFTHRCVEGCNTRNGLVAANLLFLPVSGRQNAIYHPATKPNRAFMRNRVMVVIRFILPPLFAIILLPLQARHCRIILSLSPLCQTLPPRPGPRYQKVPSPRLPPVRLAPSSASTRHGLAKPHAETRRSPCINHNSRLGMVTSYGPMRPSRR